MPNAGQSRLGFGALRGKRGRLSSIGAAGTRFRSMAQELSLPAVSADDVALVQQVQQNWNSGNPSAALDLLRPRADQGSPWAAALMAWLLMQQGYPALDESVNWAITAANAGQAAQLAQTFNNVVAHLSSYPQLAARLPEMVEAGIPWYSAFDPIGQGWNLMAQGHAQLGLQIMATSVPTPYPFSETGLNQIVSGARVRVGELDEIVAIANARRQELEGATSLAIASIEKTKNDLETSAKQAGLLVTTATSDATNALFVADAKRNTKESNKAWFFGLIVLGAAATVAVLPVVLHYLGIGATYSSFEQIALHLVSTAALATFAGVLLARARSRDHAAQRANDLSTAMGTMIAYSNQISDEAERQRFMTLMGQMVLQAHLAVGIKQSGSEDPVAGMVAFANLLKTSPVAGGAAQAP